MLSEPPSELLNALFPWVEAEISALDKQRSIDRLAQDISLWHFLHLLIWLRLVLLQDAAVLYTKHPDCSIFKYAPFNTLAFREFAATAAAQITQAEEEARLAFQHLPEHLVQSLRGVVTGLSLEQKQEREENRAHQEQVQRQLEHFAQVLADGRPHGGRSRRVVSLGTFAILFDY